MRLIYMLRFIVLVLAIPCTVLAGTYKISMLPRYAPDEISRRITPLAEYLSQKTGYKIEVVIASDFSQYTEKLKSGIVQIGYENPYIYTLASDAHEAVAMAVKGKDKDRFRGIVIARQDAGLSTLEELRGKTVSIVGFTSAGGYLSQKLSLIRAGIDPDTDLTIHEATGNKQENVVLEVYTGEADAGFIRESALHRADAYISVDQLKIVAQCAWVPNWALSVSRSLPDTVKKNIQAALLELSTANGAIKALKIDRFRSAGDGDYDSVREAAGLLNQTERQVQGNHE